MSCVNDGEYLKKQLELARLMCEMLESGRIDDVLENLRKKPIEISHIGHFDEQQKHTKYYGKENYREQHRERRSSTS